MENIQQVYVINLKECKNRLRNVQANLAEFDIPYTIWNATKGRDMSPHEIEKYTTKTCRSLLCNHGTIGCFMSHMLLWNHIVDSFHSSGKQWFLVLEDDAKIVKGFKENLNEVFADLENWHVLQKDEPYPEFIHLACHVLCKERKITDHIFKTRVVNTTRAYLISKEGAAKLSHFFKKVNYHVDTAITFHNIFYKSLAYYTTKTFVESNDAMVSTIGSKSFPRLIPDIFNAFYIKFMHSDSIHIIYDSPIASFERTVDLNILIVAFMAIILVLVANKMYIWASIYVLVEIIYFLIAISRKTKMSC